MKTPPRIAILMDSKSDLPKLEPALDTLDELKLDYTVRVMSALGTPAIVAEFAETAPDQGLQVICAASGGAAHLAGLVSAHTTLPVIGIPVEEGALHGMDALLTTVQMPAGTPVATVGVGGGGVKNAALLAARILGVSDPEVRLRVDEYRSHQRQKVLEADLDVRESRR